MAGRVTTPFGAATTAADVMAGIDLRGRRAIVTGGASGIGTETARIAVVSSGAHQRSPVVFDDLHFAFRLLHGIGGRYFEDCTEAEVVTRRTGTGVAPYARDPVNAERLWDVSERSLAS